MTGWALVGCPHCGRYNHEHSGVTPGAPTHPTDGDYSVCAGCREVSVFVVHGRHVHLRQANAAESIEARAQLVRQAVGRC